MKLERLWGFSDKAKVVGLPKWRRKSGGLRKICLNMRDKLDGLLSCSV